MRVILRRNESAFLRYMVVYSCLDVASTIEPLIQPQRPSPAPLSDAQAKSEEQTQQQRNDSATVSGGT